MKSEFGRMIEAKVRETAACPIKSARVRDAICGTIRTLALEEIARRRISNSIEKK